MILSDGDIRKYCDPAMAILRQPMIEPFSEAVDGNGIISYGLTSAGYDLRLADDEILMFLNTGDTCDPKRFNDPDYRRRMLQPLRPYPTKEGGKAVTLPPHSYVLARTLEYLRIPRALKGICTGKSTYARSMILVNLTPAEPGWEGHLTLEIGNVGPCAAAIYIGEGIAQMEFHVLSRDPEKSYADKSGKYQGQTGVTPAKVI